MLRGGTLFAVSFSYVDYRRDADDKVLAQPIPPHGRFAMHNPLAREPVVGIVASYYVFFVSLVLSACLGTNGCVSHASNPAMPSTRALSMSTSALSMHTFSVYALSKGKGVPERTRQVFQHIRALLEDAQRQGKVVQLKQSRIGLEGETRLCVECSSAAVAQELFEKIRQLSADIDLLNVVIEPCPDR
jgi:hypothetical protein